MARRHLSARTAGLPAWVVLTQLFIGLGWLRAVTEKLIDPAWWNGAAIHAFVEDHEGLAVGWYQPFVDTVVSPRALLVALVVMAAQLVAGLSLVTGRKAAVGVGVGMFLNLHFLAAGAVDPSAFYLLAQGALALWMAERASTPAVLRRLETAAVSAAVLAAVSLPFITTLHPAEVIEDPAVMFAFGGSLSAVAALLARNSLGAGSAPGRVAATLPPARQAAPHRQHR